MKKLTTGTFLLKDNKILFLVRKKKNDLIHKQGMYLPIGGHVELGESVEDCAKREVKEESGITVNSVQLAGINYFRGQKEDSDGIQYVFVSSDFEGEAVEGNEGSFEWIDMYKLDEINLYDGDRVYLKYLLEKKFFVIDFLYNGYQLVSHKLLH